MKVAAIAVLESRYASTASATPCPPANHETHAAANTTATTAAMPIGTSALRIMGAIIRPGHSQTPEESTPT